MDSYKSVLRRTAEGYGILVYIPSRKRIWKLFLTCATGFDRDLSIAGRAFVKAGDGSYTQKLIKIDRPSTDP